MRPSFPNRRRGEEAQDVDVNSTADTVFYCAKGETVSDRTRNCTNDANVRTMSSRDVYDIQPCSKTEKTKRPANPLWPVLTNMLCAQRR